ncbi:unnamed protein product [Effrenium voratum]|nr:unnamed protein product [Effrenium voratum]
MAWGYGSQRQPWQLSEEWPTVQPGTEFYAYVEDPLDAWQRTGWYQYTVAGWDKAKRLYEAWEASGLHTGLFNEKTVLAGVKRLEKGAIKGEERVVARWGRGELCAAPVDLRRWPCKAEPRRRGEVFPPCVSGYKPYGTLEMAGPMLFHLHSRLRRSRDFRKILDVGAGTGRMAKWLTLWGFEVTALDVMQPEHPEFDNIQTFDGREFPLNDKSVDCSIFSFVLHHCRHFELQQALLKEAARVTKHWIAICEDTPEETLHWKATRGHDGKGTFNSASEWLRLFHKLGLQVLRRGPIWTGPRHGPSPYFCARAFFILEVPSDLCPQPVCRGTCANAAPALPPRGAGAAEACAALQAQAKTHAQREGPDPESVAILRDIKAEWMDTDADFTAFSQLRLPQLFEQSLARQGFGAPSPIQRRAVPLALQGRDLVGVAATGSGKTLAFLLPMLLRSLSCQLPAGPFGLVLLPTRELALQVKSCVDALTEEPRGKVGGRDGEAFVGGLCLGRRGAPKAEAAA